MGGDALLRAVVLLRREIDELALPLEVPGVDEARDERAALRAQLDDYVVPRLRALDAPLISVVGGPTGAGKSTLVNSLVGHEVTRSGVLRPTTRSPVLVQHPLDAPWFAGKRVLPDMPRVTGDAPDAGTDATNGVRVIDSDALPPGLAVIDAPDIDSVVETNRAMAHQLLAAADLWLFVTTASRYADAVPWDLLTEAAARGTSLAVVLDRVPPEAMDEVRSDLAGMLRTHGLGSAPVFPIPESALLDGLLPEVAVQRVRSWLTALARDAKARSVVVRRTLTGALDSLELRVGDLVVAAQAQRDAGDALRAELAATYDEASAAIERAISDGTLLRGEVLARWQEFVGTGELLRNLESGIGRLRDRLSAALRGRPTPARELGDAVQTGVVALVTAQVEQAAIDAARRWRGRPGGAALLAGRPGLERSIDGLDERVARLVRDWQGYTLELVRTEGRDRRSAARVLSYGVNGLGVVLMLVVFSQTFGVSGAEVGIAGGSAVLAQRLLEAVFGDQAVRTLATRARQDLLRRVDDLLAADRVRLDDLLDTLELDSRPTGLAPAVELGDAVRAVGAAR